VVGDIVNLKEIYVDELITYSVSLIVTSTRKSLPTITELHEIPGGLKSPTHIPTSQLSDSQEV